MEADTHNAITENMLNTPKDVVRLMEYLTTSVMRDKPENIYEYARNCFSSLENTQDFEKVVSIPLPESFDDLCLASLLRSVYGDDFNKHTSPRISVYDWKAPLLRTTEIVHQDPQITVTHAGSGDVSLPYGDCFGESDQEEGPNGPVNLLTIDDDLSAHSSVTGSRRQSVAAESFDPEKEDISGLVYHQKSTEKRERLSEIMKPIFIFRSLDEQQATKVLDAMQEMPVKKDDTIIRQGEDGDFFYVIESGQYDIILDGKPCGSYNESGSFGELALMYNTPRAATIKCTADGVLWSVDRSTFRRIVLKQAFERRQKYESWFHSVPLLTNLSTYELTNLADALVSEVYADGAWIIRQGERGEVMYFIEEGSVEISAKNLHNDDVILKVLHEGDYFGELALILHEPRQASAKAIGRTRLASLDVSSFERLMGPCLHLMLREASHYRSQLVQILGEACLNSFPALLHISDKNVDHT